MTHGLVGYVRDKCRCKPCRHEFKVSQMTARRLNHPVGYVTLEQALPAIAEMRQIISKTLKAREDYCS